MGSENNMVAVPFTARELVAAMLLEHDAGGITLATLGDARRLLASSQPDAQQWEVYRGFQAAVSALRMWADGFIDEGTTKTLRAVANDLERNRPEILATPPLPALDAATIERCADAIRKTRETWLCGGDDCSDFDHGRDEGFECAERTVRALPNAEKRHG